MQKLNPGERMLINTKENDKKEFYTSYFTYSFLLFGIGTVLMILLSPFLDFEAKNNLVSNTWIRLIMWIIVAITSSQFLWRSKKALVEFPSKDNKKAMWFHILSVGVLGFAMYLAIFSIDYTETNLGKIIFKHLFYMIFAGLLSGYVSWDGNKTERLKEILGESNTPSD